MSKKHDKDLSSQVWKSTKFYVDEKGRLICLMISRAMWEVEHALFFEHYVEEQRKKDNNLND